MSQVSRSTIKSQFETGDLLVQSSFDDAWDSTLFPEDINTLAKLNAYLDDATLVDGADNDISTFAKLDAIVADVSMLHVGMIDTFFELNSIVTDTDLLHTGSQLTFAQLDAMVPATRLANLDDAQTFNGTQTFDSGTVINGSQTLNGFSSFYGQVFMSDSAMFGVYSTKTSPLGTTEKLALNVAEGGEATIEMQATGSGIAGGITLNGVRLLDGEMTFAGGGYIGETASGTAMVYAPDGVYNLLAGGIEFSSHEADIHGSVVRAVPLAGTGVRDVQVDSNGNLLPVDLPAPGWEETATDTTGEYDLGNGDTTGAWVEVAGLAVTIPVGGAVLTGERVDYYVSLGLVNDTDNRSGTVDIAIGVNGADPVGAGQAVSVPAGMSGQVSVNISSFAAAFSEGDVLTCYARIDSADNVQFGVVVDCTVSTGVLIVSVPGDSGVSAGLVVASVGKAMDELLNFGVLSTYEGTTAEAITDTTPRRVLGFTAAGLSHGLIPNAAEGTLTATLAGKYGVKAQSSFTGQTNKIYHIDIFRWDDSASMWVSTMFRSGVKLDDVGTLSVEGVVHLDVGDKIALFHSSPDGNSFIPQNMQLMARRITS